MKMSKLSTIWRLLITSVQHLYALYAQTFAVISPEAVTKMRDECPMASLIIVFTCPVSNK